MQIMKRVKTALTGEEGASNVEIIVWISVVLMIATVLFVFKDQIAGFITDAGGSVDDLEVK